MKLITFVDLEGRYRITTPAYNDETRPEGETDDECLERVWALIVSNGVYGIDIDHPHHYVEDSVLHAKVDKGDGGTFRYAGKPDADGDINTIPEVIAILEKEGFKISGDVKVLAPLVKSPNKYLPAKAKQAREINPEWTTWTETQLPLWETAISYLQVNLVHLSYTFYYF